MNYHTLKLYDTTISVTDTIYIYADQCISCAFWGVKV